MFVTNVNLLDIKLFQSEILVFPLTYFLLLLNQPNQQLFGDPSILRVNLLREKKDGHGS